MEEIKLVIGIAGLNGSGKSTFSKYLESVYNIQRFSVCQEIIIRKMRNKTGKTDNNFSRKEIEEMTNNERKEKTNNIYIKEIIEKIQKLQKIPKIFTIDCIINEEELDYLQCIFGDKFIMIFIESDSIVRYYRITHRYSLKDKDIKTYNKFRELHNNNLKNIHKKSNIQIKNVYETFEEFYKEIEKKIIRFKNKIK